MDVAEETKSLIRRAKKIQITDGNTSDELEISGAFYEHFSKLSSNYFQICPGKRKSNKVQVTIHSDTFLNQTTILCGLDNDQLTVLDLQCLSSEVIELPPKSAAVFHQGLSSAKCSRLSPNIFYSSSTDDGKIHMWDGRIKSNKPSQSFSAIDRTTAQNAAKKKPILTFDVSPGDQFICAGTELVEDDSYLLFWDLRSSKLMGAYWESHSDDITAVKFHPTKPTSLASGSTDGLLNVYNLMEASEDDALLYSFNTESSVEKITWHQTAAKSALDQVACITHTNDMKIYDIENGDLVAEFSRSAVATAMKRSNPDAVYLNECYPMSNGNLGLFTCSLSGNCARSLEVNGKGELTPRALFLDETSVIQTTEYMARDNRWITFDEDGIINVWSLLSPPQQPSSAAVMPSYEGQFQKTGKTHGKRSTRFKPYSTE